MSKVRNIVFDCNETILDLTTITPTFQRLFGSPAAMRLWFQELITYSQALTIADVLSPSLTSAVGSWKRSLRPGASKSPRRTVRNLLIGSQPCRHIPKFRELCGD